MTTTMNNDDLDGVVPSPPADEVAPPRGGPARWWPEALVGVATAVLYSWSLSINGLGNSYYAAAVTSMTKSWSNFFYAALDPGGWVTVDKPPAGLWLQALSARIFGVSSWSLLLPSVLCGVAAVVVLMATVRRAWGRTAGIVAGVALALTPMMLAVSRSNNPDVTLVLAVVVAAWATQRAIGDGRYRWMAVAGAACGVGFLAKLLAAGIVMPALFGAFLIAAPGPWRKRILGCVVGAVAFVAVSAVWVAAVDVQSVSSHPWIGGSKDGTAWDLVTGYNGIGRITGSGEAGPGGGGGPGGMGATSGGIDQFGGSTGILRLFNAGMGDQVMWLFPVAIVSGIVGLIAAIRARRRSERLGSVIMWLGWALSVFVVFSYASGIFHNYYVALLAPAVAALVGIGVQQLREARRLGGVVAAVTIVGTAVLGVVFLRRVEAWQWLRIALPVAAVIAAIAVGLVWVVGGERKRLRYGVLGAVAGVLLVAPAVWSIAGVQKAQAGTFPDARPGASAAMGGGRRGGGPTGGFPGGGGLAGGGGPAGATSSDSAQMKWLEQQRNGERWILGKWSSMDAGADIVAGYDVVALGGFSGNDAAASTARVVALVRNGELRFFSAGGGGFGGGGAGGGGGGNSLQSVISTTCTAVPASNWGGTGTSSIYDCRGKAAALQSAADQAGVKVPSGTGGPGGAPGGPGGAPGGGQVPGGFDRTKIEACLKKQGVTTTGNAMPDFGDPKVAKAMAACMPGLPGGGQSPPSAP